MTSKEKRANGSAADDAEFERLLDEMDELGRQADALRKKVNHLIDEMRENDVPPEDEADEEAGGIAAGGEDGVAVDADTGAGGEAVDEVVDDDGIADEETDSEAINEADGQAVDEDTESESTQQ